MIKLPIGVDNVNLIGDLRSFSWEVADILLYYSQMLRNSENKNNFIRSVNNADPVTIADLKVNDLVIKRINDKYKDINWGILSEENVKFGINKNVNNDWLWVLDPLDGTKDFIQGTSNYAMHLALNYKNRPYIGIVLIPEKDELWICNGEEAWGESRSGSLINKQVSKKKSLREMNLVTSKNHRNQILKNLISQISFKEVIQMGSIGCKIASLIKGESDIYISLSIPGQSSPKDWDFAAPEAILKATGGAMTNLENEDIVFNKTNYEQGGIIIASNNIKTHKSICHEIKGIIKKYNIC